MKINSQNQAMSKKHGNDDAAIWKQFDRQRTRQLEAAKEEIVRDLYASFKIKHLGGKAFNTDLKFNDINTSSNISNMVSHHSPQKLSWLRANLDSQRLKSSNS